MAKMMFVGAHPDDEVFMLGSTLAKYANSGHEIKIICATKGEAGQWSDITPMDGKLGEVREQEHKKSLEKLGVKDIEYLGFIDGTLSNQNVIELVDKVSEIANEFQPDILVAPDLNGISGHIDHIVMAIVATYVFKKVKSIKKLYYYVIPQDEEMLEKRNYWGRDMKDITSFVDVNEWINKKIEAANCHETQKRDTERLIPFWEKETVDHFILAGSRVGDIKKEDDLWDGII